MNGIKRVLCSVAAVAALITGGVTSTQPAYTAPIGAVLVDGQPAGTLAISPRALDVVGNAEGCRRDPYRCPSGLVTNGVGNTHGVIDALVSDEQIAKDWVKNIQSAEQCLFAWQGAPALTQGQVDAFTSFIFNTGCTRFRHNRDGSETRIGYFVRTGQYAQACEQLTRWVYGGGVKLPGLVSRRNVEKSICLTP
ncbi:lysozyme [Enterovibrio norvegicus]|uniref:lysozyme n=1 Tax=Enterovibrio norvegicus TaxID=188144 RepID=UPI000C82EC78|nr:lysozyme [Enterovibrio norvegicus]PMN73168.1 lysozyme [Enterovibrio norvegicus]